MTDINKYHSLAVSHETYDKLGTLSKSLAPGITLSRAQVVRTLVDKEAKKLNGKVVKRVSSSG